MDDRLKISYCRACGHPITAGARLCRACNAGGSSPPPRRSPTTTPNQCRSCGRAISRRATWCRACAALSRLPRLAPA